MTGIMDIWVYANNIINSARQMVNDELQPLKLSSAEGNILLHLLTREHLLRQEDLVEELEDALPLTQQELLTLSSSANALARLIGAVEDIRGRHFEENDMLVNIERN